MQMAEELGKQVGMRRACEALSVPRSSWYRRRKASSASTPQGDQRRPPRALSPLERQQVKDELYSERHRDASPREVYARLLDEDRYLCSVRTMHRILSEDGAARERRDQLRHPKYTKPELLATGANQVWSWDISKRLGPQTWRYFYLYVILDIYSRLRCASRAIRKWLPSCTTSAARGLDQCASNNNCKRKRASGAKLSPEARRAFDASSTWLSLIKLRPRRARLRFTRQRPPYQLSVL